MITEAHVGFSRLQELLELPDYIHPSKKAISKESNICIEIANGSLAWEVMKENTDKKKGKKESKEVQNSVELISCLFDINLKVKRGQLVGVAGEVGSGKTSLIGAVMGEVGLHRHDYA